MIDIEFTQKLVCELFALFSQLLRVMKYTMPMVLSNKSLNTAR